MVNQLISGSKVEKCRTTPRWFCSNQQEILRCQVVTEGESVTSDLCMRSVLCLAAVLSSS